MTLYADLPNSHHETFAVALLRATAVRVPAFREALGSLFGVDGEGSFRREQVYKVDGRPRRADLLIGEGEGGAIVEAKRWSWFSPGQIEDAAQYARSSGRGAVIGLVPDAYRVATERRFAKALVAVGPGRVRWSVVSWEDVRLCADAVRRELRLDPVAGHRLEELSAYIMEFMQSFPGFSTSPSPRSFSEQDDGHVAEYGWFLNELRWRVALDWVYASRPVKAAGGEWSDGVMPPWQYWSVWRPCRFAKGEPDGWVALTQYEPDDATNVWVEMRRGSTDRQSEGRPTASIRVDRDALKLSSVRLGPLLNSLADDLRRALT